MRRRTRLSVWGTVLALHGAALAGTAWVQWRDSQMRAAVLVTVPPPPPPPPRSVAPQQLLKEEIREPAANRRVAAARREIAVAAHAARAARVQRTVRQQAAPRTRDVVLAVAAPEPSGVTTGGPSAGVRNGRAGPPLSGDREAAPLPGCEAPSYPPAARRAGVTGAVLLRVHLDALGNVLAVLLERSSGRRLLDAAAREAVLQWRFSPRVRGGRAVPCELLQPVDFQLR